MILLFLHFDFPAEQELIALREVTQSDMRPAAGCQLGLDRVGDGKRVLVCPDADMERMPVTDLVVLHGILDQQLDRHRRQRLRQGFGSDLHLKDQVLFKPHLKQVHIRAHEVHLFFQRHPVAVALLQGIAQHLRQLLQIILGFPGCFADQRIEGIQ